MFQSKDQFRHVETCFLFTELRFFLQMPKELPAVLEVSHEEQLGVSLEAELEANEKRGSLTLLEDLAFCDCVGDLVTSDDLLL